MAEIPPKLEAMLETFASLTDRQERIQTLIDISRGFKPVPEHIAVRPFPEENRVPNCESEAFVFSESRPDQSLKFHFAVENPQGISAMATAVILDKTLSGAPPTQILSVSPDIIYEIFGRELSMGKNMGLTGMVNMCKAQVARFLAAHEGAN